MEKFLEDLCEPQTYMKHILFEIYFFRKTWNFHDKHEKLSQQNCYIMHTYPNLF
jgi:hypothetical protein